MSHLDDQREWDELLALIPQDIPTREGATMLASLLADAVQAQRPWARQRLDEAMIAGLSGTWKRHVQKQHPALETKVGRVKMVGGAKRRDASGKVLHLQLPYVLMPFDELAEHRAMEATSRRKLTENVKVQDRLLALQALCPSAKNADEACRKLGLDLDAVMAGAA